MSGPSQETPASQLWLKLASAERPSKLVDFPRKGADGEAVGQIAMRVLTQEEQMTCSAAAENKAQAILKDGGGNRQSYGYERLYSDAVCVEILYRACRDADDPKKSAFPGPKALQQALSADECGKLFEHYLTVQLELGPTIISMSDEEIEAWIDRLVEGGTAAPLDLCSGDLQKILVLYCCFRLRNSQTAKYSAGLPPDSEVGLDSESGSSPEMPE